MKDHSIPTALSADSLKRKHHISGTEDRIQLPPISSATALLPAGGCQFILLHPSISDQRCACQAYRRNQAIPGSVCECGHQACYHSPESPKTGGRPASRTTAASTSADQDLIQRINVLERQLQQHQTFWQEQLEKERQLRREETRVLREAMFSFFKFMEKDAPAKFGHLEDKIESVMNALSQMERLVDQVTHSSMTVAGDLRSTGNVHPKKTPDQATAQSHGTSGQKEQRPSWSGPNSSTTTRSTTRTTATDDRLQGFQHQIRRPAEPDGEIVEDPLVQLSDAFSLPSPPGQESDPRSPNRSAIDKGRQLSTATEHSILPSPRSMTATDSAHSETLIPEQSLGLGPVYCNQNSSSSSSSSSSYYSSSSIKRKRLSINDYLSAPTKETVTECHPFRLPIPPPLTLSD
jgi:hypothetical protein